MLTISLINDFLIKKAATEMNGDQFQMLDRNLYLNKSNQLHLQQHSYSKTKYTRKNIKPLIHSELSLFDH